jgi:hypothetical protein
MLPVTEREFLAIVKPYNETAWPMQVTLDLIGWTVGHFSNWGAAAGNPAPRGLNAVSAQGDIALGVAFAVVVRDPMPVESEKTAQLLRPEEISDSRWSPRVR